MLPSLSHLDVYAIGCLGGYTKRKREPDKSEDLISEWLVTYLTRRLMASVIREYEELDQDAPDGMYPDIYDEGVSKRSPWLKRFKTYERRFSTETPGNAPLDGKLISNLEDLAKQPELSPYPDFWMLVSSVGLNLRKAEVDRALLTDLYTGKDSLEDFDTTVASQLCQEQILHHLESENNPDELNTLWEAVISIYLKGVNSILSGNGPKDYSDQIEKITDQPRERRGRPVIPREIAK
jgi:hypothetical protein